ncbi:MULTISPECIES: hypothetical protein [unclassified Crossiella]|uniref:hypothetical protein n=1 Tax=unclassified Crossiella TaxID=2620835 RepID=UPI001FFF8601|nr:MULTISPECIES: hypothetical protein [unclassified Crossiella]MCK2240806.1 hypothetical protein [Crossiella sp. S99.2]MCK2254050.1 hypothetical protein [Crossiella sp. S99.1]
MRLVRLGDDPSARVEGVEADMRAALSTWGAGTDLAGGIALLDCTPPGSLRPLDAVIVLPRGVIVVVGVDLPGPAMKLEAPLQGQWKVDGWPLIRDDGLLNPAVEALTAASALTQRLQAERIEPLPVSTIVAVGPYVAQVLQPTGDLHRGVRVLHPAPTAMLAAVKELSTYERPCTAEAARRLLSSVDRRTATLTAGELVAEGFADSVSPDLASASTMLIPRFTADGRPAPPRPATPRPKKRQPWLPLAGLALAGLALVLLIATVAQSCSGEPARPEGGGAVSSLRSAEPPESTVDGLDFVPRGSSREADCGPRAYGQLQQWLRENPCTALVRSLFEVNEERKAAVSVVVVSFADAVQAQRFQVLADDEQSGGVNELLREGRSWPGGPSSFAPAVASTSRDGTRVRIVRAVWVGQETKQTDVVLQGIAERALRLPLPG